MQSLLTRIMRQTGLIGTGVASSSMVPTPKTPNAVQGYVDRFRDDGDVVNPDIWSRYSAAMRRPTTFDAMLELWEEMSSWDLLAAALVEIVDEALQTDESFPDPIRYECNDAKYEEELNDMLVRIDVPEMLASQVWYTAGFGNSFEKLHYAREKGVMGMSFLHPMDVRRYWLERNRQCIGFRIRGRFPDKETAYADAAGNPLQRMTISAQESTEQLWHPWDVLHFRRLYRSRFHEHGEPIFDEAQGIYKKLRMAIDQMVVFRAQIQPDRYCVNLDVAELPPADQFRMVQKWKQSLRSKLSFGPGGSNGSSPNEFSSFYQAWALDTVLWMARPKGMTHSVEKLAGTTAVPDIYDIEMLQNLLFSILGMPKWWVMGQSGQSQPPSGKALLASDIRFLRKVKAIRKPIQQGYTWLGYFHAMLQGKNTSELDIRAVMPPIGSLEDQAKMETLQAQTGVLQSFADIMQSFNLPREAWIDVIFRRYMHLPDDVVNVFMTALPPEMEMAQEGKKKDTNRPVRALVQELQSKAGNDPRAARAIQLLNDALIDKKQPQRTWKYRKPHQILWGPMAESGEETSGPKLITEGRVEYIRSSYQMDEAAIAKTPEELSSLKRSINESEQASSSAPKPKSKFQPRRYYGPRTG